MSYTLKDCIRIATAENTQVKQVKVSAEICFRYKSSTSLQDCCATTLKDTTILFNFRYFEEFGIE